MALLDRDDGYLYISTDREWPVDPIAESRLPSSWLAQSPSGQQGTTTRRDDQPRRYRILPDGRGAPAEGAKAPGDGVLAAWVPGTFRFCLQCGVSYGARQKSDFGKLASLSSEGRSTATTITSLFAVRSLR